MSAPYLMTFIQFQHGKYYFKFLIMKILTICHILTKRIQTFQNLIFPIKDLTFTSKISYYLSAEVNQTQASKVALLVYLPSVTFKEKLLFLN